MNYLAIEELKGRQILDSRGNPTVAVDILLEDGTEATAMVPSGASTGENEATELRDGDKKVYGGKGVLKASQNVTDEISQEICGMNVFDQVAIDRKMISLDGTATKSRLGANALLGVSMAVARAASQALGMPLYRYLGPYKTCLLPTPMANIINGGKHADNLVDFQEFMVMPVGAKTFSDGLRQITEVFHALKSILHDKGLATSVGDEGGFAPNFKSNDEAIETIIKAIEKVGLKAAKDGDIAIALDPACSELANEAGKKGYKFWKSNPGKIFTSDEMVDFWLKWVDAYPIVSIEDGMDENDWDGWKKLTQKVSGKIQLVGDDLMVTNTKYLKKAIDSETANSILIKVNQIGTITETFEAIEMAKTAGYTAIVSHRSGETEDTFIADLVVALGTGQIKTGSLSRTDRIAKYNRLLKIESDLGAHAEYYGGKALYSSNIKKLFDK